MYTRHKVGQKGETEVVSRVHCPNCGKALMKLPRNYPLFDVQCIGCNFRAQVKTVSSSPKSTIYGAGWEVIDKVLKSGFLMPPLIVNFKWTKEGNYHQQIRFYPLIPKTNLKKYQLSKTARRANYKMFLYTGLNDLPYFTLYSK